MAVVSLLQAPRRVFYGWWVVLACSVIGAYGGGAFFYGFTLFFNPLREDLGITSFQASLIFSVSRLEGAAEGVVVGFLIDRFGVGRVMFGGVLLAGIGYLIVGGLVNSFYVFIAVWVGVVALGVNAGFFSPALAAANTWFVRRRAMAMSLISVSLGVGGAVLVPLLGYVIAVHGWRPASMLIGAGMLVFVLPVTLFIRRSPESMGLRPDGDPAPAGEGIPSPTGGPDVPARRDEAPTRAGSALSSGVDFTVGQAFRTPALWIVTLAVTLRFGAHTSIFVHLAPILEDGGMSRLAAGGAVGLLVLLTIPSRLAAGWLGDRYPTGKVVGALTTFQVLAVLTLWIATEVWHLYLFLLLFALAYGAGIMSWAIVGDFFGRARFATIRGVMGIFYPAGAVIGPLIVGQVYDTTGEYGPVLPYIAACFVISALLYWFVRAPKAPAAQVAPALA